MSQRTAKPRPLRPENVQARNIAAAIKTPRDLEELLDSLPNDKQRAKAANLLKPYLPQFISKRGSRLVIRIPDAPSEEKPNN